MQNNLENTNIREGTSKNEEANSQEAINKENTSTIEAVLQDIHQKSQSIEDASLRSLEIPDYQKEEIEGLGGNLNELSERTRPYDQLLGTIRKNALGKMGKVFTTLSLAATLNREVKAQNIEQQEDSFEQTEQAERITKLGLSKKSVDPSETTMITDTDEVDSGLIKNITRYDRDRKDDEHDLTMQEKLGTLVSLENQIQDMDKKEFTDAVGEYVTILNTLLPEKINSRIFSAQNIQSIIDGVHPETTINHFSNYLI